MHITYGASARHDRIAPNDNASGSKNIPETTGPGLSVRTDVPHSGSFVHSVGAIRPLAGVNPSRVENQGERSSNFRLPPQESSQGFPAGRRLLLHSSIPCVLRRGSAHSAHHDPIVGQRLLQRFLNFLPATAPMAH
jgi:hypothetical protein